MMKFATSSGLTEEILTSHRLAEAKLEVSRVFLLAYLYNNVIFISISGLDCMDGLKRPSELWFGQ